MERATRFWWMLRAIAFDNVAVLNSSFDKWTAEGRSERLHDQCAHTGPP
jgi:3-mercaptopyruvate sulfurtransferase SseA